MFGLWIPADPSGISRDSAVVAQDDSVFVAQKESFTWPTFPPQLGLLQDESSGKEGARWIMHLFFCSLQSLNTTAGDVSSNLNDSIFRFITSRNCPLQPGNESRDRHKLVLGIYLNKLHRLVTFVSLHQAYSLRIWCENNSKPRTEIQIKRRQNPPKQSCAAQRIALVTTFLDNTPHIYVQLYCMCLLLSQLQK